MAEAATISSRTGLVGILGHPAGHSLSPRMHNAAFRAQGIDMVYLAFDVAPEQLPGAVTGIRALGLRGVNVTIPHKETIIGLLDQVDDAARRIGAVNTVVNDRGILTGYNTDMSGFGDALRGLRAEGAAGLTCLVAGAGGAARAVVAALIEDAAARILVWNRTPGRAEALCRQAAGWGTTGCEAITAGLLPSAMASADLLVNATSVGLRSHIKESALPVDNLSSNHIVIDLVYGPEATMLVREAKARGATAIDGKDMLVRQAAGSYELWTRMPAPVAVMRGSIDGNG